MLRRWSDADIDDLCAAWQDQELQARFGQVESTPGSCRAFVATATAAWQTGTACFLAIVDGDGALVGGCDLSDVDAAAAGAQAEVGYWVRAPSRGLGVASAAVAALLRWAETDLGLARFSLELEADNAPSVAVARQAGFVPDGSDRLDASPAGERRLVRYVRGLRPAPPRRRR
jgi:RimJ/RimL family protein N-acetyltransferase